MSKKKWFLELDFTSGEDTMKIVEMTLKDCEYDKIHHPYIGCNVEE